MSQRCSSYDDFSLQKGCVSGRTPSGFLVGKDDESSEIILYKIIIYVRVSEVAFGVDNLFLL